MILITDRKKPISALRLIHSLNHTQTNKFCDINNNHVSFIKTLDYVIDERIFNLSAGLYKVIFDGIEYIINIYFDLSNGDYLLIKNKDNITLYMAGSTPYPIVPYKLNSTKNITSSYDIECVNDSVDAILVGGKTNFSSTPSLSNPVNIDRITSLNIKTKSDSNSDSLNILLTHTLGKLPNGARDYLIINSNQLIYQYTINTSKEVLSGGLNWEYKEEYSSNEYYVFFTEYSNVKLNNTKDSIRCSHFESISYDDLINKSTKKNCIATSSDVNGIWIKIAASVLDIHGDKDFGVEMQKWIFSKAVSNNPIYIEYEISNTIYMTSLIDEYHVKTWYPNTIVTIDGNYGFSVFYKALKSL